MQLRLLAKNIILLKSKFGFMQKTVNFDKVSKPFKAAWKETVRKCPTESENLYLFFRDSGHLCLELTMHERYRRSLMDIRLCELPLLFGHIMYLSLTGLYRNAFQNIRYILESAIQSVYLDSRHSNSSLRTRIEILKEVEEKREYRAANLIEELKIDDKKGLKAEYKRLSQLIHPTHRNIIELVESVRKEGFSFATVNCEEISNVFESIKMTLDMLLFLYISSFPNTRKEELLKKQELVKYSDEYNLILLSKILRRKKKTD
jgi:hypothetical protein